MPIIYKFPNSQFPVLILFNQSFCCIVVLKIKLPKVILEVNMLKTVFYGKKDCILRQHVTEIVSLKKRAF